MSWTDERLEKLRGFFAEEPARPGPHGERRFGRYLLLEVLGEGGAGVVFRARDEALGRDVALKMLKTANAFSSAQVERFQREGRNAARLRHPAIVTVYDVGREEDSLYTTMELVAGAPFRPGDDLRRDVAILEKVARAAQYAHDQQVIHRDLKPANVIVDARGEPHLLDFGLSRDLAAPSELTQPGTVFGTPGYMSPEQARGRPEEVDARSDIYSLGAMLYQALAGRAPFEAPTVAEALVRVTTEEAVRPPGPRDLVAVCLKALARNPARRYPTAGEFADDLARFLAGEPVRARPSILARAAAAVAIIAAAGAMALIGHSRLTRVPPRVEPSIPGLIGHWPLDDGAADRAGRNHDGRIGGAPVPTAGKIGGALLFAGDYVALPSAPDLDGLQSGSYTISAWFRPEDVPPGTGSDNHASYGIVVKKGWHEGLRYTNEQRFVMDHWLADGECVTAGTWDRRFAPRVWTHVAGVVERDAGSVLIYVNGRLENSRAWPPGAPAHAYAQTPWTLGMAVPGGEKYACAAKGAIDDVRVYDRALTAAEIEALFDLGLYAAGATK
jgi:hypothetical protein